ncbi:MAG: PepSY-associated TM helix domain-containing protein [Bacteroidota bacterium]
MSQKKKSLKYAAKHQKRWFGKWHTWGGITAGFVLIIVCLTGSLLVFEEELDVWLNPELFTFSEGKERITFQETLEAIQIQRPEWEVGGIFVGEKREGAMMAFLKTTPVYQVVIDPYNGKVMGSRVYANTLMGTIRRLHRTLLIPTIGKYIVGISSIFMAILMITGLRLWIPAKWRFLKDHLGIKSKASFKRQNYDFHRAMGFYFSPFITLISLTGAAITFSPLIILALFLVSFEPPQSLSSILNQKSAYVEGQNTLSITEIEALSMKAMPEGEVMGISFPRDTAGVYTVNIIEESVAETGSRYLLFVDQYSGEVVTNSKTDFPNIGNAYVNWVTPIHYGTFGGLPTRILALIASFMGALMFLSGILIWWPRWKKQQGKKGAGPVRTERKLEKVH